MRNERLPWALSLSGVPQSGHVACVSRKVVTCCWRMALEGAQELFGLGQTQPEMLDALVVLVEGDDIGDGFFLTVIVTDDELQLDAHSRTSPGSCGK